MKKYFWIIAVLVTMTIAGCANSHSHGEASGEHAHDESLQLTAYNDDFEAFVEITPLVAGEPGDILAHFSHLSNFKPLKEGSVTARLMAGTDEVRQTVEKPLRDGIYLFSLKPPATGAAKLVFDITTPEGDSQLTLTGMQIYGNEHDARNAAAETAVSSSDGVSFTKEQTWKVDFATEEVKREPFGQVIRTTAQIQPSQIDEKMVVAKTSGIVLFTGDDIVDGKAVNAGQSLFAIESGGLADNNIEVRYNEAMTEYTRAKADYERKKELAKDRIVSERELLDAEAAYKNAEVVYNNLRRNFSSGKQAVTSPLNGFIRQVLVRNGAYAEAGQPVLVVSQNRDLLIKAELQPKYFDLLGTISTANIRVMNSQLSYSLEELNGKIVSYGKSTDLDNPLVPVVFQVRNNIGLLPGSFVEMFIKLKTNSYSLTVSNDAITEEMGAYFVYVQLTPEYFEKRLIRKGATDGSRTEILEGVSENERVVSKGAILVKLAQATGAVDADSGHAH